MERKKDKRPLWKKISPGTLVLRALDRKRRIKPKQLVHATPDQLGSHISEFELIEGKVDMDKYKDQDTPSATKTKEEGYTVKSASRGWYDVLSPDGKKMNEKGLRAKDAKALKEELEATQE